MVARQPVTLAVLIECETYRWHVAGIDQHGCVTPLVCSEPGDLSEYVGQELDEQVIFLRHRLSGALQGGCDRLWGREEKPCQIVLAADRLFPDAAPELTQRVADHFVEWMTSPPVVFLVLSGESPRYQQLAGDWAAESRGAFETGLADLLAARSQEQYWELIPTKRKRMS